MSLRYIVIAVVLLCLAAGVGYWQRERSPGEPDVTRHLAPDPECDIRAVACELPLPGGGTLSLSVMPRGIPPMKPLDLEAAVRGSALRPAWVDFAGVDMEMGLNRAPLVAAGQGRYRGQGMIPVCVRDRMQWEASVMLTDGEQWISAPFRFEAVREGARSGR